MFHNLCIFMFNWPVPGFLAHFKLLSLIPHSFIVLSFLVLGHSTLSFVDGDSIIVSIFS
jgi:hypothetical protein